jgi:hypothetical protein
MGTLVSRIVRFSRCRHNKIAWRTRREVRDFQGRRNQNTVHHIHLNNIVDHVYAAGLASESRRSSWMQSCMTASTLGKPEEILERRK